MQGVKRFGAFLVLALSMLLMQQGGLRHALQHSAHDNDGLPGHSTLCKECLSFCAHDDLVAPTIATWVLTQRSLEASTFWALPQRDTVVATGYQSRAPPALSVWL